MSEYEQLQNQSHRVTELFKSAEMAKAYRAITGEYGPSQQLIDFINHDGKLGDELGLEGFSNFSTQVQHELLLSKLDSEKMEEIATEGFTDFIKKYRKWLIVGSFLLPGIGLPLLAAGVAGVILRKKDGKVIPYAYYKKRLSEIQETLPSIEKIVGAIPSGNDKEKWTSFKAAVETASSKFDYEPVKFEIILIEKSGWSISNLITELKTMDDLAKKLESVRDTFNSKLGPVESIKGDATATASSAMQEVTGVFRKFGAEMNMLHGNLKKVTACFDAKGKEKTE